MYIVEYFKDGAPLGCDCCYSLWEAQNVARHLRAEGLGTLLVYPRTETERTGQ